MFFLFSNLIDETLLRTEGSDHVCSMFFTVLQEIGHTIFFLSVFWQKYLKKETKNHMKDIIKKFKEH